MLEAQGQVEMMSIGELVVEGDLSRSRTVTPRITMTNITGEELAQNFDLLLSENEGFEGAVEASLVAPEITFEDEGMNTLYAKVVHKKTGVVYEGSGQIQSVIPVKKAYSNMTGTVIKKTNLSWIWSSNFESESFDKLQGSDVELVKTDHAFAWVKDGAFHLISDSAEEYPIGDLMEALSSGVLSVTTNKVSFRIEKEDSIILVGHHKYYTNPVVITKNDIKDEASNEAARLFILPAAIKSYGDSTHGGNYLPDVIPEDPDRVWGSSDLLAICGETCTYWTNSPKMQWLEGVGVDSCMKDTLLDNPRKIVRKGNYYWFLKADRTILGCDPTFEAKRLMHPERYVNIVDFSCSTNGLCTAVRGDGVLST